MWPGRRIKPLHSTPLAHSQAVTTAATCHHHHVLWLLTELQLQFLIIPANHLRRGCDAPAMHLSMTDSLLLRGLQRTPLSQKDSKEAASTTPLPGGLHHWPMTIEGIVSTARASRREWGNTQLVCASHPSPAAAPTGAILKSVCRCLPCRLQTAP